MSTVEYILFALTYLVTGMAVNFLLHTEVRGGALRKAYGYTVAVVFWWAVAIYVFTIYNRKPRR